MAQAIEVGLDYGHVQGRQLFATTQQVRGEPRFPQKAQEVYSFRLKPFITIFLRIYEETGVSEGYIRADERGRAYYMGRRVGIWPVTTDHHAYVRRESMLSDMARSIQAGLRPIRELLAHDLVSRKLSPVSDRRRPHR